MAKRVGGRFAAIRLFVVLASTYFFSSIVATNYSALAEVAIDSTLFVAGEVLVTFTDDCAPTPEEVTNDPVSFGVSSIDSLMTSLALQEIEKLIPTIDDPAGDASSFVNRTYILRFDSSAVNSALLTTLSESDCIEDVTMNWILPIEPYGTKRFVPDGTEFDRQWYLDSTIVDDVLDIDAPEAWSIQQGDSNLIIGILDSGTMVDVSSTPWDLHDDFHFHWIAAEDWRTPGELDLFDFTCDFNFTDDNGDAIRDNIIGHNFTRGFQCTYPEAGDCPQCIDSGNEENAARWRGVPQNWQLEYGFRGLAVPISWTVDSYITHGVKTASIAAAKLAGENDIVGVAHGCKVYVLREYYGTALGDHVKMINHAAQVCDVINMSWGTADQDLFEQAIRLAAEQWDCVLVGASGNKATGEETEEGRDVQYPAAYPEVLSVGAMGKNGQIMSYSQFTRHEELVDVVASVDHGILADSHTECLPHPCDLTESVALTGDGTSFAAPQASGVAALLRLRFPGLNQVDIRQRIKDSAEFNWAEVDSNHWKYGDGKVNAYRALTEWGLLGTSKTWTKNEVGPNHVGSVWVSREGSRDGKYYVSGDLTIASSATLSIDPGVTVRVAPDHEQSGDNPALVQITVEGTLEAIGTDEDPIIFESFTDTLSGSSDWIGIRFKPGSHGVLKNVVIRNAVQDVVIDEFDMSVANWDTTKTLYLSSDFSIASDFVVEEEESLFVVGESDVVVTAGSGVDVTVEGSLLCKGSATKKPKFRSSSGVARSWNIITLTSYSENNLFHNTIIEDAQLAIRSHVPLVIDSCRIQDGIDGVQAYDSLTIRNTTIRDLTGNGIVLLAGRLLADNVTVFNAANGIVQSTASSTGPVVCTDSYLHDFSSCGISVPNASTGVTIERTTVEDATTGIRLVSQSSSATVDSCVLQRNDIGVEAIAVADIAITNCEIDSNSTAGVYTILSDANIDGSAISNSPIGASFFYFSDGAITGNSYITNNATGLKCDVGSSPVVASTLISDNTVGVTVLNDSNPHLGSADFEEPDTTCAEPVPATSNSIHDNSSHNVVNLTGTVTINAEGVWWGGSAPHSTKFSGAVDRHPYNCDDDPVVQSLAIVIDPASSVDQLPKAYRLSTNHPNPFNPVTTLHYDMPSSGKVEIVVFDVSGRRVRTLVSGNQPAGSHSVTWAGQNDRDESTGQRPASC